MHARQTGMSVSGTNRRFRAIVPAFGLLCFALMAGGCQAEIGSEAWATYSDAELNAISIRPPIDRRDVSPQIAMGLLRLRSDHFEEAATAFQDALSHDDSASSAHLFLALAQNSQGLELAYRQYGHLAEELGTPGTTEVDRLFSAADRHFEQALSLRSADPYSWVQWGNALFDRGRVNPLSLPTGNPEPVLAKYRRGMALDSDRPDARRALADALLGFGLIFRHVWLDHPAPGPAVRWLPDDIDGQSVAFLAEAISHYEWLMARDPEDDTLYLPAIDALETLERLDTAVDLCKSAMDRFPDSQIGRRAYSRWGELLLDLDRQSAVVTPSMRDEYERYGQKLSR